MECAKCKDKIDEGDEREFNSEILCEDCYIDVLSPAKFCDPWADYTAKSFLKNNPNTELSQNQVLIMDTLRDHGDVDPLFLIERLKDKISPEDGERECAALHRMGKILIQNNDGNVIIKLA
jgi:hypothetical protein